MSGPYFSDRATPEDRTWNKDRHIGRYEATIIDTNFHLSENPAPELCMLVRYLDRKIGHELVFSEWDIVGKIMKDFDCSSADELIGKKVIVYANNPLESYIGRDMKEPFYAFAIGRMR